MINHSNQGINQNPEQLALSYLAQAEHFKHLKMASANNSILYHQYGEQQHFNKAFAHRLKAISAGGTVPHIQSARHNAHSLLRSPSLMNSLQEGGLILFARHAEATVGEDQPNLNFQDCATQRNLSETGRRQAETYGEVLRSLDVPIEYPVSSSPFCRNIETSVLAFGEDNVHLDPFWVDIYNLSFNISAEEQQRILNSLNSMLETPPSSSDSNKVIIAHSFPEGVGFGPISNMGTVIVRPHGQGNGYEVVSQLTFQELAGLQQ